MSILYSRADPCGKRKKRVTSPESTLENQTQRLKYGSTTQVDSLISKMVGLDPDVATMVDSVRRHLAATQQGSKCLRVRC